MSMTLSEALERVMRLEQVLVRQEREISALRDALEECLEFFKDNYDADCEDGQWVGNKEMRLGMMIDEVLQKDYRR